MVIYCENDGVESCSHMFFRVRQLYQYSQSQAYIINMLFQFHNTWEHDSFQFFFFSDIGRKELLSEHFPSINHSTIYSYSMLDCIEIYKVGVSMFFFNKLKISRDVESLRSKVHLIWILMSIHIIRLVEVRLGHCLLLKSWQQYTSNRY